MSKILKTIFGSPDKPLIINGVEIPCYVLEDGQRVITQNGFQKALGLSKGGGQKGGRRIIEFLETKSISPNIDKSLRVRIENVIQFKVSGVLSYGYDALILQEIVRAISKAYLKGLLTPRQEHIGKQCEILDDGFSKVGVIALIDEVTGYQQVRGKQDLQKFLDKFLLKEHAKWVKTYADEFFETIYKMKGWDWNIVNKGKNPSVMGHYINNFVYARVAPQVLYELKKLNPAIPDKNNPDKKKRQFKHTQFIDKDFGHPKLKEHLAAIVALGRASGYNWRNFQRLINRALPKFGHTIEIGFDEEIID